MSFNLATVLRESARSHPDKPLVHFEDRSLSYAEVDELSGRVATGLLGLGLRPGQKVALQLPNVPQFVLAYFGILKAGLVAVPLNPLLRAPEIAQHLTGSDAAALVTLGAVAAEAVAGVEEAGGMPVYAVGPPGAEPPPGTRSFDELCRDEDTGDLVATTADDTALVLFTSGTTGRPKGAELSHFQLFMACTVGGETFGYRPDDVRSVLPLFHVYGLTTTLNVAVRHGGSLVLVPRFEAGAVLDAIERHRCTIFCGVPTMYVALLEEDLAGRDLSSLRVAVSGGASLSAAVLEEFEKRFAGVVILEGYGLSETVALVSFNRSARDRRVRSVGLPLWGVDVQVVDEDDQPLPAGRDHVGEIVVRGHVVMKGYYGDPDATARAVHDGWLRTGDLAYQDEDGFLYVVDRKTDLVIRGGLNVYPPEVEGVLRRHPAVLEAAVVGRPDDRLGEEVVAFVSGRPGARPDSEELVAFCRQQLAPYKYPREVHVVDELPKGPTGKVLKGRLFAAE